LDAAHFAELLCVALVVVSSTCYRLLLLPFVGRPASCCVLQTS